MDQEKTPDFYTDSVQMGVSPFGVVLTFGVQPAGQSGPAAPSLVCNMRMSIEHAKVMAMMMRKQIKVFEDNLGEKIPLHPQIWQQMGLSKQEDW